MADPTIWRQLSFVLLPLIIEHTVDLETLRNWCHVTKQKDSTFLHRIAVWETYKVVTVNKDSLLHAPGGIWNPSDNDSSESKEESETQSTAESGDESHNGYKGECPDRNAPTFFNGGTSRVQDTSGLQHDVRRKIHYREISQHIRKLIFDFVFPRKRNQEGEEELIALEEIEITLQALMSQPFVEEIEHDGVLYQQTLDRITNILTLKVLKLRETPYWNKVQLDWAIGKRRWGCRSRDPSRRSRDPSDHPKLRPTLTPELIHRFHGRMNLYTCNYFIIVRGQHRASHMSVR